VASRKAAVVKAVEARPDLAGRGMERYGLSEEEFDSWRAAVLQHGEEALKATAIRRIRQL
jgi:hypothetical protein